LFELPKPISTGFIKELYLVTNVKLHPKIDEMFKKVTDLNENIFK